MSAGREAAGRECAISRTVRWREGGGIIQNAGGGGC